MESRHRQILQRNRAHLVTCLQPAALCDALLSRGIFTQDMIEEIQRAGTRRDQSRQLVRDLETRGSRAFAAFLECLRETNQAELAELLERGNPVPVPVPIPVQPSIILLPLPMQPTVVPLPGRLPENPDRGDNPQKPLKPTTLPLNELPIPSPGTERPRQRRDSIQTYKMDASPCGVCFIINNVNFDPSKSGLNERKGSDLDCDRLERRFKSLNFVVIVKKNLTSKKIKQEMNALACKDHSAYDCCVVVILSHGTEANHNRFPGAVYGVDGYPVSVQIIANFLTGQSCSTLQGKPKLFFIQACGGGMKDTGFMASPGANQTSQEDNDDQTDAMPTSSSSDSLSCSDEIDAWTSLPTPSDILVSYSTFPGYVSWRDSKKGSWYVETLDLILEENADTNDLVTMLMMVNNEVSQISARGLYKQMPGSFNFLRKLLFFQSLKT